MPKKIFITGTNTDIGKTYISVALLKAFNQLGLKTLGIKPIASGCHLKNAKFYNADALALQQAASVKADYATINPFAFSPAIAPHIAATQNQTELNVKGLQTACQAAFATPADVYLLEGAGGIHTPLNHQETLLDFVQQMNFAVILVVGIKLGCLNHAILSYRALQHANIHVLGWIANCLDPHMPCIAENIATLQTYLPVPLLETVEFGSRAITSPLAFLEY